MDKTKCKELNSILNDKIRQCKYHEAKEIYILILLEMRDSFNSFQSKLGEYFDYLICNKKYFDDYSRDIENEINKMVDEMPIDMQQRYSLYMLAATTEEKIMNYERAVVWYKKAEEIYVAGFVKSDKSKKKIEKLIPYCDL